MSSTCLPVRSGWAGHQQPTALQAGGGATEQLLAAPQALLAAVQATALTRTGGTAAPLPSAPRRSSATPVATRCASVRMSNSRASCVCSGGRGTGPRAGQAGGAASKGAGRWRGCPSVGG